MKLQLKRGTTSQRTVIFVQDSSSTTGAGLTGLTSGSTGLSWYYWREDAGNVGGTLVSVVAGTRGTYTSGGFVEIDSVNLPGFYELGIPDAALATGARWTVMCLKGAANMAAVPVEIELLDQFDTLYIKRNTALNNFMFMMYASSDHITPATGLTITAQRSIDGAAFAACSNAAAEIGNGFYKISLTASDLNGGVVALKFTATGADQAALTIVTQP